MAKTVSPECLAEQRAIKEICNRARTRHKPRIKWLEFWRTIVGIHVGIDYEKNLTNGEAGPETVAKIKNWIMTHEADLAYELHPEYFPRGQRTDWQRFVDEYGAYGVLHTVPYEPLTLHEISTQNPINPTRFRIGQEFTFELEISIFGSVIALDHYKGNWYPIPLHEDKSFTPIRVKNGTYGFPIRNGDISQIVPLRQRAYAGEHGHCFIIGPRELMRYYADRFVAGKALSLAVLNEMAKRFVELEPHKLAVLLENVIFE